MYATWLDSVPKLDGALVFRIHKCYDIHVIIRGRPPIDTLVKRPYHVCTDPEKAARSVTVSGGVAAYHSHSSPRS